MDRLERLKIFLQVQDTGSFSRAGASLNLTQAQVSKAIKRLEDEFQITLFHRTTRKIALTEEGAGLLVHARAIVDRYQQAEDEAQGQSAEPRGRIRILTSDGTGRAIFMPHIAKFLKRYPYIKIDHVMTDRLIDLAENNIDLALWPGELKDSSYKARRIGLARRITVASPAYLKARGTPRKPEDLVFHDCIVFSRLGQYTGTGIRNTWIYHDPEGREIEVEVSGAFQTDNSSFVRDAVLQELGIYQGPNYVFADDLKAGRVIQILQDYALASLPIHVLFQSSAFLPIRIRVLADFLAHEFSLNPAVANIT